MTTLFGKMDKLDRQERLERTASMAYNKGLINNPGENNCFLNSAVQVSKKLAFKLNFLYCSKIIVASSSPDMSSIFSNPRGTPQGSVIKCKFFCVDSIVALEKAPKDETVYRTVLQYGENVEGSPKILYFLREMCRIFWRSFPSCFA